MAVDWIDPRTISNPAKVQPKDESIPTIVAHRMAPFISFRRIRWSSFLYARRILLTQPANPRGESRVDSRSFDPSFNSPSATVIRQYRLALAGPVSSKSYKRPLEPSPNRSSSHHRSNSSTKQSNTSLFLLFANQYQRNGPQHSRRP